MSRSIFQILRAFSAVVLCGLLSACSTPHTIDSSKVAKGGEHWCSPTDEGDMACFYAHEGAPVCPITYNVVQCFFYDYDRRIAKLEQKRELRRALVDALELPLEQLREKRYADYQLVPDQWSIVEIIGGYFSGYALIRGSGRVSSSSEGFFPALKSSASATALKKALEEVEEAIKCEEAGECFETD